MKGTNPWLWRSTTVSFLVSSIMLFYFVVLLFDSQFFFFLEYAITGYNHFSDVDDTLYPLSSGLSKQVTKNIEGCCFPDF